LANVGFNPKNIIEYNVSPKSSHGIKTSITAPLYGIDILRAAPKSSGLSLYSFKETITTHQ
jgi:hypothetical protein